MKLKVLSISTVCLTTAVSLFGDLHTILPKKYSDKGHSFAVANAQEILDINALLSPDEKEKLKRLDSQLEELYSQGQYAEAIPIAEEILSISISILGKDHPDIVAFLAILHQEQGNYDEALSLHKRALAARISVLGKDDPQVANSLNYIAGLYLSRGNYTDALPLYEQALQITTSALGDNHLQVAGSLNGLAGIYQVQGNYAEALSLYERALQVATSAPGENDSDVAKILNNLAELYRLQGNYVEALPLYEQALQITTLALGEDHPDVAKILNDLALLYQAQGNYAEALPLQERALNINISALDEYDVRIANSLNSLALLHQVQGNYTEALPLHERALEIRTLVLGKDHLWVANSLNNLALIYQMQGKYAEALPLYERALEIRALALGEDYPDGVNILNNLAVLHLSRDETGQAIELLQRTAAIEEYNLSAMIESTSEVRRQRYIDTLNSSAELSITMSFENTAYSNESESLALTNILRRKGRVLEATSNTFQRLRSQLTAQNQNLLDELSSVRTALTNLQFDELGDHTAQQYKFEIDQLEDKAEGIEETISRSSAVFQIETEPVSVESIQPLIPQDGALVEFIRYYPFKTTEPQNPWQAPRYAAFVLTQQGAIQSVDLGEAAAIDQLAVDFQRALSARSGQTDAIARTLNNELIAPIRPLLGNKAHLLLSPDSQLNLIPFDALIDEQNDYLIESYQISYLTSGRDLLKLKLNTPSQQSPAIFANPDYDRATASTTASENDQRSVDSQSLVFNPLPGTAEEVSAIAPLLPNATIYTKNQATENNLKQISAPSILHIATHGFFLPDVPFTTPGSIEGRSATFETTPSSQSQSQLTPSNLENPLLRSGLAFAGANARSSGSEDGIFTALEASSLNLYGTQLVVLSACETGVGAASSGEGVYGLRRAFTIAGAQSQIMSLWNVSDSGTSELMRRYYENLIGKRQGRAEALRSAQLEMLNSNGAFSAPYYWSSFIFSGDWRSMDAVN